MRKFLRSPVYSFMLGLVTIPLLQVSGFWISFALKPTAIEAKGLGKAFREIKEINPGERDHFYSLEFPGELNEFHAFARRLKFEGYLTSPTEYSYTTPDFDQRFSISFSNGKIRYVVEGAPATRAKRQQ